jgi:hypothetical protein
MKKITTHPFFIKTKRVFDSCKTKAQFQTAKSFWRIARKRTAMTTEEILKHPDDYFSHKVLWQALLEEYECRFQA